ncbi:MAG: aryl-sulfate sulfotransferase [Haloarculaceae archaeon]
MGRLAALVCLVALLVVAPVGTVAGVTGNVDTAAHAQSAPNPCVGTVTDEPDRATVMSIQGARGSEKTDAMLVSFAPDGSIIGVHDASANGRWWAYDVDRLASGDFLMGTTQDRHSVVEEIDAETGEHVSVRHFEDTLDSHDVDLINGDELLINDMSQDGEDRVFVYSLTSESVTWEYYFANHTDEFPRDAGGEFGGDWTHNNDVEEIEPGVFMVSLKNFHQVVAINRSTKEVVWRLGEDGDTETLNLQHNPDYMVDEQGRPTVIVADSANDRVVEYRREGGEWNRTWSLVGGGLNEPRDADRLPGGNTLVSDRRGDRLLEVTPTGEVVWEVYAPWQPYDAERLGTIDESSGPAMADAGVTGAHEMTGSASPDAADKEACYSYIQNVTSTRLVPEDDPGAVVADGQGGGSNGEPTETRAGATDGGDGTGTGGDSETENGDGGSVLGTTADDSSSAFGPTGLSTVLALLAVLLVTAALAARERR